MKDLSDDNELNETLTEADVSSGGMGGMDNYEPWDDSEEIAREMAKADREQRVRLAAKGIKLGE